MKTIQKNDNRFIVQLGIYFIKIDHLIGQPENIVYILFIIPKNVIVFELHFDISPNSRFRL